MPQPPSAHTTPHAGGLALTPVARPLVPSLASAVLLAALAPAGAALAQTMPATTGADSSAWRHCSALSGNDPARLACFDAWAAQQDWQVPGASAAADSADGSSDNSDHSARSARPASALPVDSPPPHPGSSDSAHAGCRDPQYSDLTRFWELESGSDCGIFNFRGYRPITVSIVVASGVNRQPLSSAEGNSATTSIPYRHTENRIQLSVRTKLAQDLLTQNWPTLRDSLWFGYTQQSYWQLFTPDISRPFRTTDHEPELIYVYPSTAQLPLGWRWRYSGIGLVHQSNGQSKPLSRSWNRVYLMTGIELDRRWSVNARIWERIPESADSDDNPGISDYIGRAELSAFWNLNQYNTLGATVRHTLSRSNRGSVRLEWLQALGAVRWGSKSSLRLHTALFRGHGDSVIDYNYKRTVFSLGLSLVDF
ncbi:phospholipase [Verminephrobacter eiseniae]|uniref:phospholipase A n=1 Tax=Verminephrobacter eiseniae TaxID=364317 RepID=UPI0022384150|nr:phospholipase A [Verminephrobacter eiseniae]MCW5261588.1 phospholipase [Verminephrobacter eiseniae]